MTDFVSWNRTVDWIINTQGRWYGIGTGDGEPIMTLPEPLEPSSAPKVWMSMQDIKVTIPTQGEHGPHATVDRLITQHLTRVDGGLFVPATDEELTLMVADRGRNGTVVRRAGVISHAVGHDPDDAGMPVSMTIHAADLMEVWHTWPCPSFPLSWWMTTMREYTTDESGVAYTTPRQLALVEMATTADGYTKYGPAETVIRELIQQSLDAVASTTTDPDGTLWVDNPFHVVDLAPTGNPSKGIYIEVRDGTLWETISPQAQNAGVLLGYRVWWPGDPPVRSWQLANSTMTPEQVDLTPEVGLPYRQVVDQTFEHPMIVLTADQIGG